MTAIPKDISIPEEEFRQRVARLQDQMERQKLDALWVYGDEYRKENLRYVCNFWPIFERAACVIPRRGTPVLVGAPEGERYAREMSAWEDMRVIKEFAAVTVPEEVDYPLAKFSSLADILREALSGGRRLGVTGLWDMSGRLVERIRTAAPGAELTDCDSLVVDMRLVKSDAEIACLKEAGRLACIGFERVMATAVPGNTELQAAGAGEGAARMAGAEAICFHVMGSGPRTDLIIPRPTTRVLRDGDMVISSLAVQYEGYIATAEFPFVCGRASDAQKRLLALLFEAANVQLKFLRDGAIAGEMVRAVRDVFRRNNASQYDIYPPMHGCGLAEAESPYPDEKATYALRAGMTVNSDISLFGHPGGSNRIEEGFVIRASGPESLTPLVRHLCEEQAETVR